MTFVQGRRSARWLILICLTLAAARPLHAQPLAPEQIGRIDAAANKALTDTGVPAASIAIVRDGRIVYTQAYGMERPGRPARTGTRYPIASISKQFTAAAILILVDEGKLSLDDKVAKYLPNLTRAGEVTIRQLLSHTSGYRDYWPQDYLFEDMIRPTTAAAVLDRWGKAPLDFEPGTHWQYSNTGFVAAGLIVERVSGKPLFAFLRDHVFARLGMNPTDIAAGLTADNPVGYTRHALGPVRPATPIGTNWMFGAGQLVMTATDLARWDISVIDRAILSPSGYSAQQRDTILSSGLGTGYGLGVHVANVQGHRLIEHGGGASGFFSENRIFPDDRLAIVVLDNAEFGDAEVVIADAVQKELFADSSGVGRARVLLDMLRSGQIDRSTFTANGNFYFSPTAVADYRDSMTPLGEPTSIVQTSSTLRGGLTLERFMLDFATRKVELTIRAEPGEQGRVEEFILSPVG